MIKWDGYIHINGKLQVKRMFDNQSSIDQSSPFVIRYISPVEANTREEAEILLKEKAGM